MEIARLAGDCYEVGHLHGAQMATDLDMALEILSSFSSEVTIVTYCLVGYRSSCLAELLEGRGFALVYNLEGSIFEWVGEGRLVCRNEVEVETVHPYDEHWVQLLEPDYWQF